MLHADAARGLGNRGVGGTHGDNGSARHRSPDHQVARDTGKNGAAIQHGTAASRATRVVDLGFVVSSPLYSRMRTSDWVAALKVTVTVLLADAWIFLAK